MSAYKHILIGLDLSPESQEVIDRVKFLLEPLAFTYGGDILVDLSDVQTQLQDQAATRLSTLAAQLNVSEDNQHVILGHPAQEMHNMADLQQMDLIVVGSHGRHGLALVFGSTSSSVLHGASCDVLAVRISNN
jgi:universal stress protein A